MNTKDRLAAMRQIEAANAEHEREWREKQICKFCGKPKSAGQGDWRHCPTCGVYCMRKCELASTGVTWHKEPCVSCEHNPYRLRYRWNGEKWEIKEENDNA